MKKRRIIPRMALGNIRKNGATYFPYILASAFAMFTFFEFDVILRNDVINTIPRATYAKILISISFFLLGLILIPFLYYANSFLIKRRKAEIGLYNILGMEKKHIGIMLLFESLVIYFVVLALAIGVGLVFAKLIFMLLVNVAGLPVDAQFYLNPRIFSDSMLYYGIVTVINLVVNLHQVSKASPAELLSGSKKGEKEPKHLGIGAVIGLLCTGIGYYLAITAEIDAMLFVYFFLAVILVCIGTHFLFTAVSVKLLALLKKNKRFYYKASNFTTISGMYYRMKKSAAGLSNICIFSTMVIITLVCTITVALKVDDMAGFTYPYEFVSKYDVEQVEDREGLVALVNDTAKKHEVEVSDACAKHFLTAIAERNVNTFKPMEGLGVFSNIYMLFFFDEAEYEEISGERAGLGADEAIVYSNGVNYGEDTVSFLGKTYRIREEITKFPGSTRLEGATQNDFYFVLPTGDKVVEAAELLGSDSSDYEFDIYFNLIGEEEKIQEFIKEYSCLAGAQEGFDALSDFREEREDARGMFGGLVFIGVFFESIFLVSMMLIMYYKQIAEGYEDKKNYVIMEKVGMSNDEVKRNIKKQVYLTFLLPLAGALLHTIVGMCMVRLLLISLMIGNAAFINKVTLFTCIGFVLFYGICYRKTAGTYYRIVRQR